ncbi:hypothetical protein [Spirosoma sp.]|nr:hypothetical protein [Spirosoma sp.]MCX6217695.1 hypothetical protein [Spirosoma sp.]
MVKPQSDEVGVLATAGLLLLGAVALAVLAVRVVVLLIQLVR